MSDNKILNDSNITGRKCNTELDLKENIGMYNLESEKYCPKCGGKMKDLVLTSYPAQSISKCQSCEYTEKYPQNRDEKVMKKDCNKEIHAYQNEDGTYRVEINEGDTFVSIEKADINITVYATKKDKN